MSKRLLLVAVLAAGCGTSEPATDVRVTVCAAFEADGLDYGEPVDGQCNAVGIDGDKGRCSRIFDVDGNVGCCGGDSDGPDAWYECVGPIVVGQ